MDNDFQWIAYLIIFKNIWEQQKLRIIWCKRHKDKNWDDVMFSDEWIFYLKVPGGLRWVMKNEQYVVSRAKYTHKINFWRSFSAKEKWICISLTRILI